MRETADLPDRFYELYVVDGDSRLLGAVSLDRLLRTKRPTLISELMDAERHRVRATDDQEAVARLFERYNLVAVPVVDEADRLVGVVTVDDVVDVIEEEAEKDIKALGGVTGDEQLSDSVWTIARGRFNWLLVNLATAFLASSVLGLFEGELQKMVALAVLAPIVASQGGNAATQTMTIAVRALATRELRDSNARRVVFREFLVGVVNGLAFAVITGVVAYAWFRIPDLGLVIGLAMICNLAAAALGGILIPLIIAKLRGIPRCRRACSSRRSPTWSASSRFSASPRSGSASSDGPRGLGLTGHPASRPQFVAASEILGHCRCSSGTS